MIQAWRIVKTRYGPTAFDGEGARLHGGRWNSPGRPAVYVSETRALATLEVLAGLGGTAALPAYSLIGVSFAESLVQEVSVGSLQPGWDASPPTSVSQSVGDHWLKNAGSAVLRVPSAVLPEEMNYMLNPQHSDFTKITVGNAEPARLDPRLLQ